jgi:hypothetical protein
MKSKLMSFRMPLEQLEKLREIKDFCGIDFSRFVFDSIDIGHKKVKELNYNYSKLVANKLTREEK